jgi:hypothetical protein
MTARSAAVRSLLLLLGIGSAWLAPTTSAAQEPPAVVLEASSPEVGQGATGADPLPGPPPIEEPAPEIPTQAPLEPDQPPDAEPEVPATVDVPAGPTEPALGHVVDLGESSVAAWPGESSDPRVSSSRPHNGAAHDARGMGPPPGLDRDEVCAGADNERRCVSGLDVLIELCAGEPDPGACQATAASHACVRAPWSIECIAFLASLSPCVGNESLECRLQAGLIDIYCSWTDSDIPVCHGGPICCSSEPVGPDGPPFPGHETLASAGGDPPDPIGVVDPGGTGDAGFEARPGTARRARGELPLTGLPLVLLAHLGAALAFGGAGLRVERP